MATRSPETRSPTDGGALIFNTYDGSAYLGYIYAPPNMEGYYVKAAD